MKVYGRNSNTAHKLRITAQGLKLVPDAGAMFSINLYPGDVLFSENTIATIGAGGTTTGMVKMPTGKYATFTFPNNTYRVESINAVVLGA